ncbi:helix-turn-helix transcriptional regulator, partial [Streptomyces asiaticus]
RRIWRGCRMSDASHTVAQRFHLDAPGWWREPEAPELLPGIADAVWDDLRIAVRYRRRDVEVRRELEPYGLVLKAGVWYLAARAEGGFRVYRVDRFAAVEPTGARFVRDEEFDLPAFWEERAEQFARSILRERAVVRLTPAGVRRLPHVTDRVAAEEAVREAREAGEPDGQGRLTVTLPVESYEVALAQLLGLGPDAEVLGPPELRELFAEAARRTAELYR